MEKFLEEPLESKVSARKTNILNSPKKGGSSEIDASPYLKELGITILEKKQPIQFTTNINERIHRWSPYVQGFSAFFVQSIFDQYRSDYTNPVILDPFAGCGTVLVEAKLNGLKSYGTELNPLLHFIAKAKLSCWDVPPNDLLKTYAKLPRERSSSPPSFLKSEHQFNPVVLRNLEIIKAGIESLSPRTEREQKVRDLIRVAFSSILIECSNLKRSPCLGYSESKRVEDAAPFVLLSQKIQQIADDLKIIQTQYNDFISVKSNVILANAKNFEHVENFDLVITSPPYMNGLDYVINYKIEMGWLGFASNNKELKKIKDEMVACDNVSKGLIKDFSQSNLVYTNDWIEKIKEDIETNIIRRGSYRRSDMPYIVHKYFDDLEKVIRKVVQSLNSGGRFILVVGDSLIADVYVPTDLLIAKIGLDIGFEIEKIEKARERRSGQIRSYRLRESVITLRKR